MINDRRTVAVTFPVRPEEREAFERSLGGDASALFVSDMDDEARAAAVRRAEVLVSWQWRAEVREEERGELGQVRFLQLISAGVDGVPFVDIRGSRPRRSERGLRPSHESQADVRPAFDARGQSVPYERDPLLVFFAFQRYFVQGLLAGSVK